jgi:hypothetical protein
VVGDDLSQVVVGEVCRHAVVARYPGAERAVGDEGLVAGAALGLGAVVRTVAARKQAQAGRERAQVGTEGVGRPAFEPADRAGADACQHDARFPGLAQYPVKPVHAPDGHHVRHAAAADEDHVLGQQQVFRIGHVRHGEQRHVTDLAAERPQPLVRA